MVDNWSFKIEDPGKRRSLLKFIEIHSVSPNSKNSHFLICNMIFWLINLNLIKSKNELWRSQKMYTLINWASWLIMEISQASHGYCSQWSIFWWNKLVQYLLKPKIQIWFSNQIKMVRMGFETCLINLSKKSYLSCQFD